MSWGAVSQGPWTKRRKHQVVVWQNQILLLGGFDGETSYDLNDVWSWENNQWRLITEHAGWSGRDGHTAVVLHESIFVIAGTDDPFRCKNDVWKSIDGGCTWSEVTRHAAWPERWQHASCRHGERIYLSGGWGEKYFNDVWYSNDGVNWILVCPTAPWKPRMFHSMLSFKGKLYVFGGHDGKTQLRDVWVSPDNGETWSMACASAPWESRQGHATAVSKDCMYMMGGFGGAQRYNDFWKTLDGVTWVQITSHSEWTARQGHAATYFRGSVYICGGFDEGGYSNSVYKCVVDPLEEALFIESFSSSVDAASVTSASDVKQPQEDSSDTGFQFPYLLDCLNLVRDKRMLCIRRDKVVQDIKVSMEAVHKVYASADSRSRARMLSSSSADLTEGEIDIQLELMDISTCSIGDEIEEEQADQSNIEEADISRRILTRERSSMKSGSAKLHDSIELNRKRIVAIQQSIRKAAEADNAEAIPECMQERADIALRSMDQVIALQKHLTKVRDIYDARHADLLQVINQLEEIRVSHQYDFSQLPSGLPTGGHEKSLSKRRAWEGLVGRVTDYLSANIQIQPTHSEDVADTLKDHFEELGTLSKTIALLLQTSSTEICSEDNEGIVSRMTNILSRQHQLTREACKATNKESELLHASIDESTQLLKTVLTGGMDFVQGLYAQSMSTLTEVTRLHDDISEWHGQLQLWQDPSNLKDMCEKMISEVATLEDALLQWENQRIDIKSAMEKATLTMNRSKSLRPHAESIPTLPTSAATVGPAGSDIDRLRLQLMQAEKESKQARRILRTWYRSHRHFAVNTAPELFLSLPDLRSPGSVLGDGGFASSANIPRRQLHEYDDVVVFTQPNETAEVVGKGGSLMAGKMSPAGRHLLLKASFEGQEVILKGFAMHNHEQRKGMDREIEILSRLKSDLVIHPQAIVDASSDATDPTLQITLFIEYPYYIRGNLASWLTQEERKPWELQGISRQVLFAIMYLHDHGIVHKDIKPSNILMREDGRIMLTDFELARVVVQVSKGSYSIQSSNAAVDAEDEPVTVTRSGTSGYMAPEVETGQSAGLSSDMYSFGCLLYFMHFPREFAQLLSSQVVFPRGTHVDADLCDLIQQLLSLDPTTRPTAVTALTHAYFRATFVDRLMQEGEIVEQDRKLDAVRNLLSRTRAANRNVFDRLTVSRATVVEDVLRYFQQVEIDRLRHHLKVTFSNEPGVDEGGLLVEMFSLFFEQVFRPSFGLFEDCNEGNRSAMQSPSGRGLLSTDSSTDTAAILEENVAANMTENDVILPSQHVPSEKLSQLRAVGRAIVKALYEGRRIGNRLCPSVFKYFTGASPTILDLQLFDAQTAKSLRWLLTTVGVEDLGLHFEEIGQAELGQVSDSNKAQYVRSKVQLILVDCRLPQLAALRTGFMESLQGLSTEAAPFLTLLSHTDWRIMLCGETMINAHQIISALKFSNFPRRSKIPQWLTDILLSFSEDTLRKFLVFVTGSPSLTHSFLSSSSSSSVKINVRHQHRSLALPTAHTCFFYLDIPDYDDRTVFQSKLIFAIQNANTFEIV